MSEPHEAQAPQEGDQEAQGGDERTERQRDQQQQRPCRALQADLVAAMGREQQPGQGDHPHAHQQEQGPHR